MTLRCSSEDQLGERGGRTRATWLIRQRTPGHAAGTHERLHPLDGPLQNLWKCAQLLVREQGLVGGVEVHGIARMAEPAAANLVGFERGSQGLLGKSRPRETRDPR